MFTFLKLLTNKKSAGEKSGSLTAQEHTNSQHCSCVGHATAKKTKNRTTNVVKNQFKGLLESSSELDDEENENGGGGGGRERPRAELL